MSKERSGSLVLMVIGSKSDLDVLKPGVEIFRELDIPFEVRVASAHRTPEKVEGLVKAAGEGTTKVIIAVAGAAAHLAGVVAGHTLLPVLGVPVAATPLAGFDSLLSMAQMPRGVPVGVLSVGGTANAALLSARIIALSDKGVRSKLERWKNKMKERVETGDKEVREMFGD